MVIQGFTQIGKRQNNEDSFGHNDNLAMVCDGMGGHVCGEMASGFIVEQMLRRFNGPVEGLNKELIQKELDEAQQGLNKILDERPELEKMGTTFAGLFFSKDFWYAAHIGDSRIYLFRPSERKLWHTWDQSLVGELMRLHEITREAGRHHPMANRIANAILANPQGKVATASVVRLSQLQEGDVFLLCSDGVVEAWGDHELAALMLDGSLTVGEKCERLKRQCDEQSKDNNTALLVQVEHKDAFRNGDNEELAWVSESEIMDDYQEYLKSLSIDDEIADEPATVPEPRQETHAKSVPAGGGTQKKKGRHAAQRPAPRKTRLGGKEALIVLLTLIIVGLCLWLALGRPRGTKTGSGKPRTERACDTPERTANDNPIFPS